MKIAISIGGPDSGRQRNFHVDIEYVVGAEKLGADQVWSAEAWGQDAIAPLAWIGAKTERIKLGTGIMQISARAPVMTAMTAMTMASISNDRFLLGLGVSGPQVVEGLHGRPFRAPLTRMRETIEIIRIAFSGEKIQYQGKQHELPLPGGQGKALRLAQAPNPHIPIYLATLAPKALELTGELADGWLGSSITPEGCAGHLECLRKGAERSGRKLEDLDIIASGVVGYGDPQQISGGLAMMTAFQLGSMGSATTNFYADSYRRSGWSDAVDEVQSLWTSGKQQEAIAAVPVEMIQQANFIGDDDSIRDRVRAWRDAGVTTLRLEVLGNDPPERLAALERVLGIVHEEC